MKRRLSENVKALLSWIQGKTKVTADHVQAQLKQRGQGFSSAHPEGTGKENEQGESGLSQPGKPREPVEQTLPGAEERSQDLRATRNLGDHLEMAPHGTGMKRRLRGKVT